MVYLEIYTSVNEKNLIYWIFQMCLCEEKKIFFCHVQSVSFISHSLNCSKCCDLLIKMHSQIFWNSQRNHNSQWYQKLQRYRKSYIEYSGTIEYKEQQIVADSNGFIKYECCRHQHFFLDKTRHFLSHFMFGKKWKIFFKLCFFHNMALKSESQNSFLF